MRIGILTYHRAHNYGAMLQAYATKTFLQSLDLGEVRIMDYEPEGRKYDYAIFNRAFFSKLGMLRKIKYLCRKNPLWMCRKHTRRKIFIEFYHKYLASFWRKESRLDVLIYGSDQIWNIYDEEKLDELCYYGDNTFCVNHKIAYSASMGEVKSTPLLDRVIRTHMSNFQAISVREASLQNYITQLIPDLEIQVTVDPVFLLSMRQWEKLMPEQLPTEKYILVYNLRGEPVVEQLAKSIQKRTGYAIKYLTFDVRTFSNKDCLDLASPCEFLSLIKNAQCVVASSFHGVAFSIIFHTPFYASLPNHSLRIKSLLKVAGLEERWVEKPVMINDMPIDWGQVDEKMKVVIDLSKSYLQDEIKKCKL